MKQKGNTHEGASALDDGLLALALAFALIIGIRFIDYAYDDAYITYRYARNLAAGHGLVYNLGQDFLGTTTPLYSLLLAALSPWIAIPKASGILSLISLLGAISCCEALGRQARIRFAGPMAALFLVTEPQIYQIFGGETLLVYFLLPPAGLVLHQSGRTRSAALVFGLAILGRMDAGLFVGLVYGFDLLQNRRIPVLECMLVGALLLPWFLYSYLVFGQLFPATLETKMAMGESGVWKLFFPGSLDYLTGLTPYQSGLAGIFVPLLAVGLWRVLRTERIWLFFLGTSLLFAIIYQWILASAFSHWYLASLYFTHALLLGAGLRQIGDFIRALEGPPQTPARRNLRSATQGALLAAAVVFAWFGADRTLEFNLQPPRRQLYTDIGNWIETRTRKDESVAYFEIGYLGWFSQRTIVDPVGLVTPGGLDSIRQGRLHWIFEKHAPDYFIHNSIRQADPLLASQAFRRRYQEIERFKAEGYPGELILFKRRKG